MPGCIGEGAAAAAPATVGVGTGDRGVILGVDASRADMRVDMMVDRTVGIGSGEVVMVGVESMMDGMVDTGMEELMEPESSCAGVVLEDTQ